MAVNDGWIITSKPAMAVNDGWIMASKPAMAVNDGWIMASKPAMAVNDGWIMASKPSYHFLQQLFPSCYYDQLPVGDSFIDWFGGI